MSENETPVFADDYETIHNAVLETARGRWFLSEFARRNRTADTRTVLQALERLETLVKVGPPAPAENLLRNDLVGLGAFVAAAKIALTEDSRGVSASVRAVARTLEQIETRIETMLHKCEHGLAGATKSMPIAEAEPAATAAAPPLVPKDVHRTAADAAWRTRVQKLNSGLQAYVTAPELPDELIAVEAAAAAERMWREPKPAMPAKKPPQPTSAPPMPTAVPATLPAPESRAARPLGDGIRAEDIDGLSFEEKSVLFA